MNLIRSIYLLMGFACFTGAGFSAEKVNEELKAFSRSSKGYKKMATKMRLSEKAAYDFLVKVSKGNKEIALPYISSKAWIIGNRYFFPRTAILKHYLGRCWEWGVYVDGKTGAVEVVESKRKITFERKGGSRKK